MKSYRESHVGDGIGASYDEAHENRVDSLIWDSFVKPLLIDTFRNCIATERVKYLDFACGTGRITKVGAKYFSDTTAVDISEDMLAIARERVPNAKFFCADVTRNPDVLNDMFDCVSLFRFVLNAEPELRREVLKWISNHMPRGAILIFNNHMNLWSFGGLVTRIAVFFGSRKNYLSHHQVKSMLSEVGFEIEQRHGYRLVPSIFGTPIFGSSFQLKVEKFLGRLGLGVLGVEHVYVARRI